MANDHKTILILGASSFLGSNLAKFLKSNFKVIGTYHGSPVNIPGVFTFPMDIFNRDECQLAFHNFRPDFTIFCAGISSLNECAKEKRMAELLNTNGLIYPTEFCHRYKSRIIYLSSSDVFSGSKDEYREIDLSDSHTVLGKTQSAGEFYLEKNSLDYLIFRTCQLYGRDFMTGGSNYFEYMQEMLIKGREISCDELTSYGHLDINYLGMVIELAIKRNLKNHLLQVCTKDISSFFEFSKAYCKIFGENEKLIKRGRWNFPVIRDLEKPEDKERKFKMIVENLENYLDITMPTIAESLSYTFKRFKGQERDHLAGRITDKL
ncbi:MAG: hypothetical protein DRQ88_02910 [Epsilonproteobacteria bacterium]|nr:MAG: hypothetical protein DRQ89_01865 [Campylobacterota bacterium]RLA67423.1 MAG: hypothetical protein DRQ88_02910 [Campylobacterota bacterium]